MDEKLLTALVNAHGVSGNEEEIRNLIQTAIKPHVDEVKIDKFGNLIARKKGKGPPVMLAAHMDEVGLMVKHIGERGAISFATIGYIEPLTLIGQRVYVLAKKKILHGVITTKEISDGDDVEKLPPAYDLYVDTGMDGMELLDAGLEIGDVIALARETHVEKAGNHVIGKALDDRIGCFILIELAKKLKKVKSEICYVFTVQEEVGLYGAMTSVWNINPAWAIAVDVTNENSNDELANKLLGEGPTITAMDESMIGNKCINGWLKDIAEKHKIPYQVEVGETGTTDALVLSTAKGGIPVSVVGVAVKNLHTTMGIAHMRDIKNAIRLLELLLQNPPKTCV